MTERMGYLIDLDNPYITLDNDYIETGWWIIKEFFKAGMVYEGHKILPYCPRCGTGLASHEVAQGYKEVKVNDHDSEIQEKRRRRILPGMDDYSVDTGFQRGSDSRT